MSTIRTATSASLQACQDAVDGVGFAGSLVDGDTLKIPSTSGNPVTWLSPLVVTGKNLKIIGAGMDSTVLYGLKLFQLTTVNSGNTARLSALTIVQRQIANSNESQSPSVSIGGISQVQIVGGLYVGGFRVDHLHIKNADGVRTRNLPRCFNFQGYLSGVVDHCFIDHDITVVPKPDGTGDLNNAGESMIIGHDLNPDGTGGNSNYEWTHAYDWAGKNSIFFEDNIVKHKQFFGDSGTAGGTSGGHSVTRHNTSCGSLGGGHGTETGSTIASGARGERASEIYHNYWVWRAALMSASEQPHCSKIRAGGFVMFNNRYDGLKYFENGSNAFRATQNLGCFGGASGYSPWDKNERADTSQNGAPAVSTDDGLGPLTYDDGQTSGAHTWVSPANKRGYIYATGNNGTGSGKQIDLPDLPIARGAGNWVGYVIINRALGWNRRGDNPPPFGWITKSVNNGSGGTLLTIGTGSQNFRLPMSLAPGETWEIRHVLECADAPGSGAGISITGPPNTQPSGALGTNQDVDGGWNFPGTNKSKLEGGAYTNYTFATAITQADQLACRGLQNAVKPGYSLLGSPSAAMQRIGADWNDPTGTLPPTVDGSGNALAGFSIADTYTQFTYPHPLISGAAGTNAQITSTTFNFNEGDTISSQIQTTGYTASPTFSILSGTLPTGLTMTSGGLLTSSGSPLGVGIAGTYTVTVRAVYNPAGETDDQLITVKVAAAATRIIGLSGSMAFGAVLINTTSVKQLTITNSGSDVLTISGITFPAGFSVVVGSWESGTIAAGASKDVQVKFAPTTGSSYGGTITIASDKTSGTNTATASGSGATKIVGNDGPMDFGAVTVGQVAPQSLTISNSGNSQLVVSGINYPPGFAGDYSGGNIAAGGSVTFDVRFSPTLVQDYSDILTIVSNATSGDSTVAITASGTAAVSRIIQLGASGGNLAFGDVNIGTVVQKYLIVINNGNDDLTVSDVTVPAGYDVDHTTAVIAPGSADSFLITFTPTAAVAYNGTATVTSDATSGVNTMPISGTGVAPLTRIVNVSILEAGGPDFGNVNIGSVAQRTLVVHNTGTGPLTISDITAPTAYTGGGPAPGTAVIDPGGVGYFAVTFTPVAQQTYSGNLTVVSDATSGTNTLAVTGKGIPTTTRIIALSGNLAFGNVLKSHSAQRQLIVTNNGSDTLEITDIQCPSNFSPDFTTDTLAPGASDIVTITFAPNAHQNYGGTITVVSNRTAGVNTIACSGTGVNKKQVPFFLQVS